MLKSWREKKDNKTNVAQTYHQLVNSGLITLQFPFAPLKHTSDFKDQWARKVYCKYKNIFLLEYKKN